MSNDPSLFNASSSATGYLYQCKLALADSLRCIRLGTYDAVILESADDVAFTEDGDPKLLLQTKHVSKQADLTDFSPDLWKTLRSWIATHESLNVPFGTLHLQLVTTGQVKVGSASASLLASGRNEVVADQLLVDAANKSVSETTEKARKAYLGLTAKERLSLLRSTLVLSGHATILDLDDQIHQELRMSVNPGYVELVAERIESWWYRECVLHLATKGTNAIPFQLIQRTIRMFADQFTEDNLPVDFEDLLGETDVTQDNRVFVQQLRMIALSNRSIEIAIRNYYRAFEQRSKWVREDLLHFGEMERYERRLVEEWENYFSLMHDRLGSVHSEVEQQKAATDLYQKIHGEISIPIRPRVTEPYVMRGTFHILADRQRVGWHPNFIERLKALLQPVS